MNSGEKWGKLYPPQFFAIHFRDARGFRLSTKTMFLGTYRNTMDNKNRMTVPSRFRNQLGGKCVLTQGFDECLYIYTMDDFKVMADKLSQLPQSDADFREFISDFFSNTEICDLDSQGRILIPQHLREYACISKDLVTKGAMNKIEIWSADKEKEGSVGRLMKDKVFTEKLAGRGI